MCFIFSCAGCGEALLMGSRPWMNGFLAICQSHSFKFFGCVFRYFLVLLIYSRVRLQWCGGPGPVVAGRAARPSPLRQPPGRAWPSRRAAPQKHFHIRGKK